MTALLNFSHVGFRYEARMLFDDFSASVASDACIALIGPNGAGKSTLLRLAAGTLSPQRGEITLHGRRLAAFARRAIAQSIALVPQDLELPFPFTVEQFVRQGRTPYLGLLGGFTAEDRLAVERALELTGTAHLRSRIFNQLSGGERQRAKIALGLAQQPRLLLLDEPTQHLDIGRQQELIALIRHLSEQGIALVAAMHDLAAIESTFSSVWAVVPGEPVRCGPPEKMLRPESLEQIFPCLPLAGGVPRTQIPESKETY